MKDIRISDIDNLYVCTIYGEPASKANSRRIVSRGGTTRSIKSQKALSYRDDFEMQVRVAKPLLKGDLAFACRIFYASKRPDLDESLILDLLQSYAYKNDRQVKTKLVDWALDRDQPRTHIAIAPRNQTEALFRLLMDDPRFFE